MLVAVRKHILLLSENISKVARCPPWRTLAVWVVKYTDHAPGSHDELPTCMVDPMLVAVRTHILLLSENISKVARCPPWRTLQNAACHNYSRFLFKKETPAATRRPV